jgi:hypothetical protein
MALGVDDVPAQRLAWVVPVSIIGGLICVGIGAIAIWLGSLAWSAVS